MKKQQKQTIHEVMKKSLRKEYFYLKRDLLLYCQVDFGKLSKHFHYAAFDTDGISIYEYDKTLESKMKLITRHPWSSWQNVKVDHYLTNSQFIFQGEPNWILYIMHKGKEVQQLIETYTTLSIEEMPRPAWRKIPGYRSKTKRNIYIASLLYSALLSFLFKLLLPYKAEIAMFSLSIGIMLLGLLCLTIGLIEPTIVLPKLEPKTREKVLYIYSYLCIAGFISIFIFW